MRILIIGGSGMLGHQLWRHFHREHETWVTLRKPAESFRPWNLFDPDFTQVGVEAADFARLDAVLHKVRPDVVLNCVGIIKQLKEARSAIPSITINSLLPHRLAESCGQIKARLILFSTDCVFSGKRGGYTEADTADAEDLYGRTKFLGEVGDQPHVVTLRSSIIGRELGTAHSLVDWFLAQHGGRIKGYTRALYSGLTTMEMARVVERVLTHEPKLSGLWQVAGETISKFDLLMLAKEEFKLDVEIEPYDEFHCDRSLRGDKFAQRMGYMAPDWRTMLRELAAVSRANSYPREGTERGMNPERRPFLAPPNALSTRNG